MLASSTVGFQYHFPGQRQIRAIKCSFLVFSRLLCFCFWCDIVVLYMNYPFWLVGLHSYSLILRRVVGVVCMPTERVQASGLPTPGHALIVALVVKTG